MAGEVRKFSAVVFNMVSVWVEKRRRLAEKELGVDEEKIVQRVKKEIDDGGMRLDYIVMGSWSLKAAKRHANLLGPLLNGLSFLHAVGIWSPPVVFSWAVITKNKSLTTCPFPPSGPPAR